MSFLKRFIKRLFKRTEKPVIKKSYEELFTQHPFLRELRFSERHVIFPDGSVAPIGTQHEVKKESIADKEAIIKHHVYEKSKCRELFNQIKKVNAKVERTEVINLQPDFIIKTLETVVADLEGQSCTDRSHWVVEEVL